MMTPYTVTIEKVNSVKYTPGIKCVLGPQIAVVVASCNKIECVYKPIKAMKPMVNHPEVDALLLGAF